jgi:hypothetical protein
MAGRSKLARLRIPEAPGLPPVTGPAGRSLIPGGNGKPPANRATDETAADLRQDGKRQPTRT